MVPVAEKFELKRKNKVLVDFLQVIFAKYMIFTVVIALLNDSTTLLVWSRIRKKEDMSTAQLGLSEPMTTFVLHNCTFLS